MKTFKAVVGLILAIVGLPIWFYIQYKVLVAINASELVFFLFYVYMPITILGHVASRYLDD